MTTTTALVTGANKGIGRETVRRLAALGWTVWLGARDTDRGTAAAAELAAGGDDVRFVPLDVTSDESVATAVQTVGDADGRLDVLVNNAGISGRRVEAADTAPVDFLPVFGVNVLGPVRTTGAFLDLLRRSEHARVVMVSSGMGSFGVTTDPDRYESTVQGLVYQSSKAALNMITSQYAKGLSGILVNAVDPGYTATDLNGFRGTQSIDQAVEAVVAAAALAPDGPTGTFSDARGTVPW